MFLLALSLTSVIAGCIWNSFELEHVVSHPEGGKDFGYGLTFSQCVFISIIGGVHFFVVRLLAMFDRSLTSTKKRAAATPLIVLSLKYSTLCAALFWVTNVINNIVFSFGIAVPIQQVVRSSSLLFSAVTNYVVHGKRFSFLQVLMLLCITIGIATLSLSSVSSLSSSSSSLLDGGGGGGKCSMSPTIDSCGSASSLTDALNNKKKHASSSSLLPDLHSAEATFHWLIGVGLLCLSAFLATFLGVAQDFMFKEARSRVPDFDNVAGLTEEALFISHLVSVCFFGAHQSMVSSRGVAGPLHQIFDMPHDMKMHLLWNVVSQYVCVWGVFTLARVSSSFFLTMATTLRKFFSLVLSLMYFGHAWNMSRVQLGSIALVTFAMSVYPFLKSPPPRMIATVSAAAAATAGASVSQQRPSSPNGNTVAQKNSSGKKNKMAPQQQPQQQKKKKSKTV